MSETKRLSLEGPAGALEAQLTQSTATPEGVAVLCHPHPQYGGSMHDAVLATAESQLTKQNVAVLRFNFRGVGNSEGAYGEGLGEAQDVLAAAAWATAEFPSLTCLVLGYSFGAAAAWRALQTPAQGSAEPPPVAELWLVAPPVMMMASDSAKATATNVPTKVFHPADDDFTTPQALHDWVNTNSGAQPSISLITQANHFFHGAQEALAQALQAAAVRLFSADLEEPRN